MRLRKRILSFGVLPLLAVATAAQAQEIPTLPPPYTTLDENGVDLATGRFQYAREDLSIGAAEGPGRLSYSRFMGAEFQLQSNWEGFVTRKLVGGTYYHTVTWNGRSDHFMGFIPVAPRGQTLGQSTVNGLTTWTYKTGDGVILTFGPYATVPSTSCTTICGRLSSVEYPSGEKITIHWQNATVCNDSGECQFTTTDYRIIAVSNNLGYHLKFEYALQGTPTTVLQLISSWKDRTKVIAVNTKDQNCVSAVAGCPGTWPAVNYSSSLQLASTSVTATMADNAVHRYTFDANGRLAGIRYPTSATDNVAIAYDANGRVSSIVNGNGTWTYAYSISGTTLTTTRTDPQGHTRVITANMTTSRPLTIKDELNRTTTIEWDANNRLSKQIRPEGDYVQYSYDARSNVTQTLSVPKAGSGLGNIATSASFDASCANIKTCNKPSSTTDERGNTTDYTYDAAHGGVLTVTTPAPTSGGVRPQARYSYAAQYAWYKDAAGTLLQAPAPVYLLTAVSECQTTSSCAGTADETKTAFSYQAGSASAGSNLLPTSISSGAGNGSLTTTGSLTFDSVGNLTTLDGPLAGAGDTTRLRYDSDRRIAGLIGPDPDGAGALKHQAVRYTYNGDGQVTSAEAGTVNSQSDADWAAMTVLEQGTAAYDTAGRRVKETLVAGGSAHAVTQYSYDNEGRLDCTAQRMNPSVFGVLPPSACSLGTQGSDGPDRIVRNTYSAANELTKVQTGYGTAVQADEVTNTYTSNGKLATVADGKGNLTTYEYDGLDRLSKTRFPPPATAGTSSTTDYEQLSYDAASNVIQRRLRDGQAINYGYDNLNRLVTKDVPNNTYLTFDVVYSYDLLGHLTLAQDTNTHFASFSYDALGRKLTEGSNFYNRAYQYDAAGRRTRITHGDGLFIQYDYDAAGNMTAVRENGAVSGIGVLAQYSYDSLGRRTGVTFGNGVSQGYNYDAVSRLSQLTLNLAGTVQDQTATFAYNPASQISQTTRANDSYAFTARYNVNRPYTANGLNQYTVSGTTSLGYDARGNLTSSGSSSYSYTAENRLVTFPGAANGYAYEPLGRLVWEDASTTLQYDGDQLLAELAAGGAVARRYVYGPGVDTPIVWYEGTGTADRRFLLADERGSIVAVTDASGAALAINRYDEYGIPQAGNLGRFQYTGQAIMPGAGLYYYKARMYSPTLGRFMQTDPIGYGDGMNLYAYVHNDPINATDPTGLTVNEDYETWTGDPWAEIVAVGRRPDDRGKLDARNTRTDRRVKDPRGREPLADRDKDEEEQEECGIIDSWITVNNYVGGFADATTLGALAVGAGGAEVPGLPQAALTVATWANRVSVSASGTNVVLYALKGNWKGATSSAIGAVTAHSAGQVVGALLNSEAKGAAAGMATGGVIGGNPNQCQGTP